MSLAGKTVLVTRPAEQSKIFIEKLDAVGAKALVFPVIQICPVPNNIELDQHIDRLNQFDWIILSSVNGAKFFVQRCLEKGLKPTDINQCKIAVVGSVTKEELERQGIAVNFIPSSFVADTIGDELPIEAGTKILFPRSNIARKKVIEKLSARGAEISEVASYQTEILEHDKELILNTLSKKIDFISFTSASCVNGLKKNLQKANIEELSAKTICIGPITKKAAEKHNMPVDIMADPHTVDAMIDAMLKC